LQELSGKAYQRDLDIALSDLYKQFEAWRQGKVDCWDLNGLIYKFHDGISRDLYKSYVMLGNSYNGFLVAYALGRGKYCVAKKLLMRFIS